MTLALTHAHATPSTVHYDICIIGAGAGGSALALALAPTGKSILVLNRLGSLPREAENWDAEKLFVEGRYKSDERWVDARDGSDFQPAMFYWLGGNTKVYGSALLRLRPEDFGPLQTLDGVSPAWPIGYADLAPYYDRAEALYHVHGRRGADPFEPPAGPFPHPAVAHDPRIAEVADGLRAQGIDAFELPMGVKYSEQRPGDGPFVLRETFAALGRAAFDGYPDLLHLKCDAEVATVEPLAAYDNVTLLTDTVADTLETTPDGRAVRAAVCTVGGETVRFTADVFSVSCGAVQSAALLLRSATEAHPNGLANGSDQLGRNLMRHVTSKFYSVSSRTPNPTRFQKTLAVNDFYFGVPGDTAWDGVPLGHVHLMGKHAGWQIGADLVPGRFTPAELDIIAAHSVDWWVQGEDLPLAESRVTLAADGRIQVAYTETNRAAQEELMNRLEAGLRAIGFDAFYRVPMPLGVMNHQCGTARMGTDAGASVLTPHCRAHEVDNLFVVDASCFPSSGATNPTLTIAANALRVGDYIASEVL